MGSRRKRSGRSHWVRRLLGFVGILLAYAVAVAAFGVAFAALMIGPEVSDWDALPVIGWSALSFGIILVALITLPVIRIITHMKPIGLLLVSAMVAGTFFVGLIAGLSDMSWWYLWVCVIFAALIIGFLFQTRRDG